MSLIKPFGSNNWYERKQVALYDVKYGFLVCPKCGSDEVYYENPRTGNGLYNCDDCGYAAHERKFPSLKVRKCIMRRWRTCKRSA